MFACYRKREREKERKRREGIVKKTTFKEQE
jgi:hypothetical protein